MKNIINFIKYLINCVLNLIYIQDEKCIICSKDTDCKYLCKDCRKKMKEYNKIHILNKENYNINCYSTFYYSGIVKELILKLKYKNNFIAGMLLAEYMLNIIKNNNLEIDLITYVPSTKIAIKKRGYNQSEYLAKHIGRKINIPVLKILEKTCESRDQIGLNDKERWNNLKGSFRCINNRKIKNKKILLIDDVITTGATCFYCGKTMYLNGAKEVNVLTAGKSGV